MIDRAFTSNRKIVEIQDPRSLPEDTLYAYFYGFDEDLKSHLKEQGFRSRGFDFGTTPILFASKRRLYRGGLKKAFSPSSKAMYMGWHENKPECTGLLIQYLPPDSITSKHYHEQQTEIFHILEGQTFLNAASDTLLLSAGSSHRVEPLGIHQLKTKETPSLNIIELLNVNYKDHVMVEDG